MTNNPSGFRKCDHSIFFLLGLWLMKVVPDKKKYYFKNLENNLGAIFILLTLETSLITEIRRKTNPVGSSFIIRIIFSIIS